MDMLDGPFRKIIHIDMDAFYASVEQRNNPELRGKPVAVGGTSRRGVVCAASYEARRFGVRSAMPTFKARELCPHLILVPTHFDQYKIESLRIREILEDYTEQIEPLSLDEAYLDVSHHDRYAWDLAKEIRRRIWEKTQLTASCGIAPNKLLAKIASDWRKPNGQFAVPPEAIADFVRDLPLRKLWGVGPKAAEHLKQLGLETCGQMQLLSRSELIEEFGSFGHDLYWQCRGVDERPVSANRVRKSVSNERTFSENKEGFDQWLIALDPLHRELLDDLERHGDRRIHKLFVRVKYADFSRRSKECVASVPELANFRELLGALHERDPRPIRLLGCGVRFIADAETGWVQQQLPLVD